MGYNTLRQKKLLKAIQDPEVKTLRQAGAIAGYSDEARSVYRPYTKLHIAKHIASNPEAIKEKYEELHSLALQSKDYSTARGVLQDLARINALFIDRSEIKTTNDTNLKLTKEDALNRINRISQLLDTKQDTEQVKAL